MRTPRSRLSKSFSLKERLTTCAQAIEFNPEHWRGSWHSWAPEKPENLEEIIDAAIESYQTKANGPQHPRENGGKTPLTIARTMRHETTAKMTPPIRHKIPPRIPPKATSKLAPKTTPKQIASTLTKPKQLAQILSTKR